MNSAEDRADPLADSSAIDRLVAGELADADRRDLLLRLENDPDGWRRCALAFLEDQAWRGALAGTAVPARSVPAPLMAAPARRSARRLSTAASLVLATFAAGFAAGGATRARPPIEVARPEVRPAPEAPAPPRGGPIHEAGSVALVDHSDGEAPPRRVPILEGAGLDDRWLGRQPPSVPGCVRAQWERQGYQVEERRSLVSVTLEDGRRVSIPVDEVELEYVGQRPL